MKRNFEILIDDILENIDNIESFSKNLSVKELYKGSPQNRQLNFNIF